MTQARSRWGALIEEMNTTRFVGRWPWGLGEFEIQPMV